MERLVEGLVKALVKALELARSIAASSARSVAIAVTFYAAGKKANAQASSGFKVLGINHFSSTCTDYSKPRHL